MKLLFLTPQLPYPPISGGTISTWKLIKWICKNYNTDIVTLLKDNDTANVKNFVNSITCNNFKAFPVKGFNSKRNIINLLRSYIANIPLTVFRNSNKVVYSYIKELVQKRKYDAIIADHYVMFQYIPSFYEGKRILREHNAEYIIWKRMANVESNILKRWVLSIESKRIKNYEYTIGKAADKILCVSREDIEKLTKLDLPKEKFYLVPPVGREELLTKEPLCFEKTKESLLFIGTLSWEPNIDGITWFLENVWGYLKSKFPNLIFYIVGKNPPNCLIKLVRKHQDVILTGFVEDLEVYYQQSRIFIAPLRAGSGVKIKNLDAMYRGLPILTTSIGAEGIDGKDQIHFMIANDEKSFIKKASLLLTNKNFWYKISRESRNLVRTKYTSERAFCKLKEILEEEA